MKEINIKIKTLKSGQLHKYGDSEYEYELEVKGINELRVKKFCTRVLEPCSQTYEEWGRDDADNYFEGYYEFEQLEERGMREGKYRYFVHSPSTH